MKYRKRPVVIEAFQWTMDLNQKECPLWFEDAVHKGIVSFINTGTPYVAANIETLEGIMMASRGDYIIRGVNGELYPCKPDIFEKTYEPAE